LFVSPVLRSVEMGNSWAETIPGSARDKANIKSVRRVLKVTRKPSRKRREDALIFGPLGSSWRRRTPQVLVQTRLHCKKKTIEVCSPVDYRGVIKKAA